MTLSVQCERDEDGRWLAKMPGAIAYGETIAEAEALLLVAAAQQADDCNASPADPGWEGKAAAQSSQGISMGINSVASDE